MPRPRGGARRSTRWVDQIITTTRVTGGVTGGIDLLSDVSVEVRPGLTIVRTLVDITALPTQAPASFGTNLCLVAGGVISEDAFGAVALPDLNDDEDYPLTGWTFKVPLVLGSNPTEEEFGLTARIQGDFRSMRKLGIDSVYTLFTNNIVLDGVGVTVRFAGLVRTLVKLA